MITIMFLVGLIISAGLISIAVYADRNSRSLCHGDCVFMAILASVVITIALPTVVAENYNRAVEASE